MTDPSACFLFTCCQAGAERLLKAEMARQYPHFAPAFSRPGLVTFKVPADELPAAGEPLLCLFARCHGSSLGTVRGEPTETLAARFWELAGERPYDQLHVWERDRRVPGERGFEPGASLLATQVAERLQADPQARELPLNAVARPGHRVLDCIVVEPDSWLVGEHVARTRPSRWPGGVPPLSRDEPPVSRTYFKTAEALLWADFPIGANDVVAEIGSAPGGSCQALLEQGWTVWGIDPAEMDARVLKSDNFRHFRKRARDMRRREFAEVRWMLADANVVPQQTLDTLQDIVTHPSVHIQGLLLTFKLSDDQLLERLPGYLERIREWGFRYVRVRQLAFNRHELCVAALRRRFLRRVSRS